MPNLFNNSSTPTAAGMTMNGGDSQFTSSEQTPTSLSWATVTSQLIHSMPTSTVSMNSSAPYYNSQSCHDSIPTWAPTTQQTRPEVVRSQSRGCASSSPRFSARTAPYSLKGAQGGTRWLTGSYNNSQARRQSPFLYGVNQDTSNLLHRASMQTPSTSLPQQPIQLHSLARPPQIFGGPLMLNSQNMIIPQQLTSYMPDQPMMLDGNRLPQAPTLASHGDFTNPPDLYASLHKEPCQPPPKDMKPSDHDMVPYKQELRFKIDLYTPTLVRGHGNKREGWCGLCKPGQWLILKDSAYWYDKTFTHGISAATCAPFQEPLDKRRMDSRPDVWEGFCGSCNKWITLVDSKKERPTWFRHAYKCHTHAKVKTIPRRRRVT